MTTTVTKLTMAEAIQRIDEATGAIAALDFEAGQHKDARKALCMSIFEAVRHMPGGQIGVVQFACKTGVYRVSSEGTLMQIENIPLATELEIETK